MVVLLLLPVVIVVVGLLVIPGITPGLHLTAWIHTSTTTSNQTNPGGAGNGRHRYILEHKQTFKNVSGGIFAVSAGVGMKMRWGIANGTLTATSTVQNYTNRLICQLYVSTEMLAHPDAGSDVTFS